MRKGKLKAYHHLHILRAGDVADQPISFPTSHHITLTSLPMPVSYPLPTPFPTGACILIATTSDIPGTEEKHTLL